jgi:hypothetical protein
MAIASDTITVWHNAGTPKQAQWTRSVVFGCRIDWAVGYVPAGVGPTTQTTMKAYLFKQLDVVAGDRIAVGVHDSETPVHNSMRVATVATWFDGGHFHHMEVGA